jgi:hypothetical protein
MKSSRLAIKWSFLLIPLMVTGIYGQQAGSANLDKEKIAFLSDLGQSRFTLSSEGACQQINSKPSQGVDIDLTDSEANQSSFDKASTAGKFPETSKVLILGGQAAFPI